MSSLCAPNSEVTCFGCCPPIRPAHYDPLDYVSSLKREFLENRRTYLHNGPRYKPIIGYSCWALGFLNDRGRRVGCLLHPRQNRGLDLRPLINYGNKCRRESCSAADNFALLPPEGRDFWLPMVHGLNSFHYSSKRSNPLFHLLLWGPEILETLRLMAVQKHWTVTELCYEQQFILHSHWKPQAHRYIFRLVLESVGLRSLECGGLDRSCRKLLSSALLLAEAGHLKEHGPEAVYTHTLPLEKDFLDFLRLCLGWRKASLKQALKLKECMQQKFLENEPESILENILDTTPGS